MKYLIAKIALPVLAAVSTVAYAGEYNFKPGLWETTSEMKVTGVPAQMAAMMSPAPMTEQHCMTDKDVLFNADQQCTYDKTKNSPTRVTFNMSCPTDNGTEKGKGEIHFNGKNVNGWFEMTSRGPTGPMTMKNTFAAKYIGACNQDQ